VRGDAIADCRHAMLSHAEADVAPTRRGLLEVAAAGRQGKIGGSQVGRTADELRQDGR
jgi:hypothetical protein